jgi:hypothetical protein
MSDLYGLFWVIPLVIGPVAVCKVAWQVHQNRNHAAASRSSSTGTPSFTDRPRSQNATAPGVYYADNPHGRKDCAYRFDYKYVYDTQLNTKTWRAYILRMPSLCGRSGDGHSVHRWSDANGNYWVCWDSPVNSLKDMQAISRFWANNVQEYIATGKRFG